MSPPTGMFPSLQSGSPSLSPDEAQGRRLLAVGLCAIGLVLLDSTLRSLLRDAHPWRDTLGQLVIGCFVLVFCFRGSRHALVVTRLLVGLYSGLYLALTVIIVWYHLPVRLQTWPERVDAVWSTGKILGLGVACWTVFWSRSVRAYLRRTSITAL